MAVFDEIADEAGRMFGLGGKARFLVAELVRAMVDPRNGGVTAVLERFRGAGREDIVDGWLGKGRPQRLTRKDVDQGVGADTLARLAGKCSLAPDTVAAVVTKVLPKIMPTLLPGGTVPDEIPAEVRGLLFPKRDATVAAPPAIAGTAATPPRQRLWWWPVGVLAAMLAGWLALSQKPMSTPLPSAPVSGEAPPAQR